MMNADDVKIIFKENLNYYLDLRDKTQLELSKYVGVSNTAVNNWVNGYTAPRMDKVDKICEFLSVTRSDLFEKRTSRKDTINYSKYGLISLENRRTKKVPILGDVACGVPIYADETYDDYIEVDEDIKVDFALRTKGDSMIGDNIVDGDIILVKKVSMVEPHEIAVVVIEDEATLKRVKYDRENNIVMLIASNHNVPPIVYSGEELERINILGKAVLLQRRL